VVIPLYNKENHIHRALNSVLSQTVQDFEIIVIDDGSTDNGAAVVQNILDARITLIRQENAGVSSARNRGIDESCADFIAFLDADDEWKRDHLYNLHRLISDFPQAGIYATAYEIMLPTGKLKFPKIRFLPPLPWDGIMESYFKTAAESDPPVWTSTVCIPRKIFGDVGNFCIGKRMGEDLDMWGRVALKYPVAYSRKVGATYYHNLPDSACSRFAYGDQHPFIETACKVVYNNGEALDPYLPVYIDKLRIENAKQYVLAGEYKQAQSIISECSEPCFAIRKLMWGSGFNKIMNSLVKCKANIKAYLGGR
jgi:glycosyltransferase involved in cell wall biosynthesis